LTPGLPGTKLHVPPACDDFARIAPVELRKLGLGARRGGARVRICRALELERLRSLHGDSPAERLLRERGLGPWSVGGFFLAAGATTAGSSAASLSSSAGAATAGASSLTSASSGSSRLGADAGSRAGRPPSCSSRTANGPASQA